MTFLRIWRIGNSPGTLFINLGDSCSIFENALQEVRMIIGDIVMAMSKFNRNKFSKKCDDTHPDVIQFMFLCGINLGDSRVDKFLRESFDGLTDSWLSFAGSGGGRRRLARSVFCSLCSQLVSV